MDNQQIVSAINEAIKEAMPSLIDKVIEKLNNPKPKKWKDLTSEDLTEFLNSYDYKDWCRAAAHPNLRLFDIDRVIAHAINCKSKNWDNVLKSLLRNPKITSEQAEKIFNYKPFLTNYFYLNDQNPTIVQLIYGLSSSSRKVRKKYRENIKQKIFNGEFDNYSGSGDCSYIFGVLKENRPQKLIQYTKHEVYNIGYFAEAKLQRLMEIVLDRNSEFFDVFEYFSSRYDLKFVLKSYKNRKEADNEKQVAHGIYS